MLLCAAVESRFDFGQNTERNPHFICCCEPVGEMSVALKQIREAVRV